MESTDASGFASSPWITGRRLSHRLLDLQTLTLDGHEAVRYTADVRIGPERRPFRLLGTMVLAEDRTIRVDCVAPQNEFSQFEPEFRACLNSLRVDSVEETRTRVTTARD